jgi:hypothetical protein
MKYKIYFTIPYLDGNEDSMIIEGNTIEEIQIKAYDEAKKRGADLNSLWSEELDD